MLFSVEFYVTAEGKSPLVDFLEALKRSAPDDHAALLAGLTKLRDRRLHRPPLCKSLGDGLFELRHLGKLNTRLFWFFMAGRRIVVVYGIRNKAQAVPARYVRVARERRSDWLRRTQA